VPCIVGYACFTVVEEMTELYRVLLLVVSKFPQFMMLISKNLLKKGRRGGISPQISLEGEYLSFILLPHPGWISGKITDLHKHKLCTSSAINPAINYK